jgi:AraC-like DNA-binding protein
MVFLKPGEIFRMSEAGVLPGKGWLLAFHPDLLFCTSLNNRIGNYTFFSYRKEEALHLSQRETATVTCCLENIEEELHHAIDTHSGTILSRHIELLLDYCTRFYERQFVTREGRNKVVMERLEILLDAYIASGRLQCGELPSAEYCAEHLGLSVAYFCDLMKWETGKTPDEYFCFKRLEFSKKMLLQEGNTPLFVAQWLGFPNVQYFSLIFRKITGVAPNEYRYTRN